jgi:pyruvate-ferredoxin/flavodoxin oxidoreductase
MSYGHVYVARVALGAKDAQTVRAITEAESYPGPSLVIAYSQCIAHGYDLVHGLEQHKLAVDSGMWDLFRYDPRRAARGEPPLQIDSGEPKTSVAEYLHAQGRFQRAERRDPARFRALVSEIDSDNRRRLALYREIAHLVPREA